MKAEQAMGLVSAGSVNRSFLTRMPALLAHIGPIKASSAQGARRVSKTLRSGYAVSHYSALEFCSLLWIAVPEGSLDRIVRDLPAQMPVHHTMIVICGSQRDSTYARALRTAGARVATVNVVEESREKLFVGEGHPDTLRRVKRLLAENERKLISLNTGAKPLYFAGSHLATHLLLPWLAAAVESLRSAGFPRREAIAATEARACRVLRMYGHSGVKAWKGSAAVSLRKALERDLERLGTEDPRLAALYAAGARLALSYFSPESAVGSKN